jgi:hypothetical protein
MCLLTTIFLHFHANNIFFILARLVSNIDARPGISSQVLAMLKERVATNPKNNSQCSVMIGGMSIRKLLDWDSKRQQMVGFVDLGAGSLDNDVAEATEVIVIMAVVLQGHWKIPGRTF